MRTFRDINGRFILELPHFWEYKIGQKDSLIQFVSKENPDSCFQITFLNKGQGSVPALLKSAQFVENKYYSQISFNKREFHSDGILMIVREALVQNHFIMAAYITSVDKRNSEVVLKELGYMDKSLASLVVAPEVDWTDRAINARFNNFMISLLASIDLINKAMSNGSQIELVILFANQIDALLRIALILKKQIENQNTAIDLNLIYQGDSDKAIFEREIYKQAFDQNIISKETYDELMQLYDIRNKVVHRYIISDLKTNDIVTLVTRYMDVNEMVSSIVKKYEKDQFEFKIGIYGFGDDPFRALSQEEIPGILAQLHEKHNNQKIIEESTIK